ncbi:MAG TPA: ABC transporter substrate-binding protein [Candidatus Methylomirabilis sp.]|nr:ABC transporter substrate-binding protein [Candidatus Methylomirabilis sp.]
MPGKGRVLVWWLILAALWTAPCAAAEKVRLAIPVTALTMLPVYLAQGLSLFAEEGLEVEGIATQGAGLEIRALLAGQVEFTFTSGDAVLAAVQVGQRLAVVFSGLNRPIINWAMHRDVAMQRGLTSSSPLLQKFRALKGLTIGLDQKGALAQHLAEYGLRKAGLDSSAHVKLVSLGSGPEWPARLRERRADVALGVVPLPEMAVAQGHAILFVNNAAGEDPSFPEFLMGSLVVRQDFLEKYPGTVRKMVRALYRANHWALANPPEAVAATVQPFLSRFEPAALLTGVKIVVPALSPHGRTTERAVEVTGGILEQSGLLKKKPAFPEIVVNDFVPG